MSGGLELKYDFTQLNRCESDMTETIRNTRQIYTMLKNLRSGADETWAGKGKTAYLERHSALMDKLTKLADEMENNQKKLARAANIYRTSEQQQLSKVKRLSEEDIF